MSFLIKIGYGRAGRWDGFTDIAVDEASFRKAESMRDEWDDDDFNIKYHKDDDMFSMAALLILAGFDGGSIDLEDFQEHPRVLTAMETWTTVPGRPPFSEVHIILIWNTHN